MIYKSLYFVRWSRGGEGVKERWQTRGESFQASRPGSDNSDASPSALLASVQPESPPVSRWMLAALGESLM